MRTVTLFPLSLLLACQPADGGSPGPQGPAGPMGAMGEPGRDGAGGLERSGSRIKVQVAVVTTEDGAVMEQYQGSSRVYHYLYDSKLSVPCFVGKADDGVTRCLPNEDPQGIGVGGDSGYVDSQCTKWLLGMPPGVTRKYWSEYAGGGFKTYYIGPKVAAPTKLYRKYGEPLGCASMAGDVPKAGLDWYEAKGNPIAPTEFVAAEAKVIVQ